MIAANIILQLDIERNTALLRGPLRTYVYFSPKIPFNIPTLNNEKKKKKIHLDKKI